MDRSRRAARLIVPMTAIAVMACSRKESLDQSPPARTAPWLANGRPSQKPEQQLAHYQLLPEGEVTFEIPGRSTAIRGRFRNIEGKLSVDQADLARSRASVRLDLTSIEVEPAPEGNTPNGDSTLLLESLGLGTDLSEQVRWARLEVTELRELSSPSVSLSPERSKDSLPRTEIARGDAGTSSSGILRTVTAHAVTSLDLHMHRTVAPVRLRAVFDFSRSLRQSNSKAAAVEIASVTPMVVSLEAHGIRPQGVLPNRRNSARIAKVSFVVRAERVDR